VATVSLGLASKSAVGFLVEPQTQGGGGFCQFGPQNRQLQFGDLGLKITAMVSWFGPQNQVDFGLSVAPQNRQWKVDAGHTLRSSGFLRVEASLARVFQSDLKTGGNATADGARGTIIEVASESNRRRTGRCDGLHRTLLFYLCRFYFVFSKIELCQELIFILIIK
jgi:hypothetical protein